jgi:hypothetical protein
MCNRYTSTMHEPWWVDASNNPRAFRDPASVASLVAGALSADPAAREAAAGALSRVVKALDDEPVDDSIHAVARRLPELVRGLVDRDPFYSGQMISIVRRIAPDARTVEALLDLLVETPPEDSELLVAALGLCADAAWSERVEAAVAACLDEPHTRDAAAYVFYSRAPIVRRSATVRSLGAAAIAASANASEHAIGALCRLLGGDRDALATAELADVGKARPDLRDAITKVRGLFARG